MKIAIIIPYIKKIEGNRMAFLIARELAKTNDVYVFAHTVVKSIVPEIIKLCGRAHFNNLRSIDVGKYGIFFALNYQFLRGKSRQLARFIINTDKFDHLIVISNEGHWLPGYMRNRTNTKFHLLLMELHDHGIISLQMGELNTAIVRTVILSPFYGVLKIFERKRLSEFNTIFTNSNWTKAVFEYLYGMSVADVIYAIDLELFKPSGEMSDVEERYIAVPSASLAKDYRGQKLIKMLADDGIPVKLYGSFKMPGLENLGYISDEEMVDILSGASATLFLFNYEALGLIPFESLACGTPVITYYKEGPFLELKDNPNVKFIYSYEELKKLCLKFLSTQKDWQIRKSCRDSVVNHDSTFVAQKLIQDLDKSYPSESNS